MQSRGLVLDSLQTVVEIFLPAFRQCLNLEGTVHGGDIRVVISFQGIEPGDFRDRDGVWLAVDDGDWIGGADLALARDGEVEASSAAEKEPLHHVVSLKFDSEFVAGETRLGYDNFGGADGIAIAEVDGLFEQAAINGEVLSKAAEGQGVPGQLYFPEFVMLDGIAVDGFEFSAVDAEVGLTVAVEIEFAESDAARDRLLIDAGGYLCPVPCDLSREPDVD